jgi:hypothetical protein
MNDENLSTAWVAILRIIASRELRTINETLLLNILQLQETTPGEKEVLLEQKNIYAIDPLKKHEASKEKLTALLQNPLFPEEKQSIATRVIASFNSLQIMSAEEIIAIEDNSRDWSTILDVITGGELRTRTLQQLPVLINLPNQEELTKKELDALTYRTEIASECHLAADVNLTLNDLHSYFEKLEALIIKKSDTDTDEPLYGGTLSIQALTRVFKLPTGIIDINVSDQKTAVSGYIIETNDKITDLTNPKQCNPCKVFLLKDEPILM